MRGRGVLALVMATVLWSVTGVFVKHFSLIGLDGDTQNLFRYLSSAVGLWVVALAWFGRESLRAWRQWHLFLLPTAINCIFQVVMVSSLYHKSIYPGLMSLLQQSSVIFSTVLAYILFHDERGTIRSWKYLVGSAVALGGVAGVILFREGARGDFGSGVLLILLSAFLWSCYTLAMKPVVRHTRPLIGFAMVATFTTLFFAVLTPIRSEPGTFFRVSLLDQFWVILSGVACISAAHSLYFRAVERLGVAICGSFLLVQPLFTNLLSAGILKEQLAGMQMVMGAVLLGGAFLVVRARRPEETPVNGEGTNDAVATNR